LPPNPVPHHPSSHIPAPPTHSSSSAPITAQGILTRPSRLRMPAPRPAVAVATPPAPSERLMDADGGIAHSAAVAAVTHSR
jgi:hypothetical protein